jgi:hypothetical protein
MLIPQDDFIGHQLPTSFACVGTSDPAWMERMWFCGHLIPAGDVIFELGIGWHPNRNVLDGFAGATVGSTQYNFRASRSLKRDSATASLGPLKITVLEGMRELRLQLEPNESKIAFDVIFTASAVPHEENPHFRRRFGRVTEDLMRYSQVGRMAGWLEVAGKRYELTRDNCWAQRDHSWGIRTELRTDPKHPMTTFPPFFYIWSVFQTPKRALHVYFNERAIGNKIYLTGEDIPVGATRGNRLVDAAHEMIFADDPLGQTVERAELKLTFEDGSVKDLGLRTLKGRYYQSGGCYGGLNGWFHGDDKGEYYQEQDTWDLDDAHTRKYARTLSDHVVEIRYGDEVGYGILEFGVIKGFPAYEHVQMHPAP